MDQAFKDMRLGRCDAAIVAGVGIILKPTMSLQFKRLNMLSPDGKLILKTKLKIRNIENKMFAYIFSSISRDVQSI